MCTSLLSAWDGEMPDIEQRVAFAVVAKSPIERLVAFKKERGWRHLKLYSSAGNSFNRDYFAEGPNGEDDAALNVFTRRDGTIRHFWGGEMGGKTADPGQDPRGAPDLMPLWTILDTTPEGRGTDWYPKLEYGAERIMFCLLLAERAGSAKAEPAGSPAWREALIGRRWRVRR